MVEDLLLERNYQQVVYLGDGRGDFCPCTRLGPNDHVIARQTYPDGSPCALLQLLQQHGSEVAYMSDAPAQPAVSSRASGAAETQDSSAQLQLRSAHHFAAPSAVHSDSRLDAGGNKASDQLQPESEVVRHAKGAEVDADVVEDQQEPLPPPPPRRQLGLQAHPQAAFPSRQSTACAASVHGWVQAPDAATLLSRFSLDVYRQPKLEHLAPRPVLT